MERLEGETIVLRALEPEDLEVLYKWENNPEFWDVGDSSEPISKYAIKEYIAYSDKTIYEKGELRMMIVRKKDNKVMGSIDIYNFEAAHLRAGIGILIDPMYQQRGYAKEAIEVVKRYASSYLHVHQLYSYVTEDNTPSRRLFEGCRFENRGILKDWIKSSNEGYKNVIVYSTILG